MSKTLDQRSQEYKNIINQLSNELNQNDGRRNQIVQLINENAGALKLIGQLQVSEKAEKESESTKESVPDVPVTTSPATVGQVEVPSEPKPEEEKLSGARAAAEDARERAKNEKLMEQEKMKALQQKSQK